MSPQVNLPSSPLNITQQLEPAVVILLPFDPKIMAKAKIEERLRQLVANAGQLLQEQASRQDAKQLILQMEALIKHLDYNAYHQSLALFATPYSGKISYWAMSVPETLAVGNDFSLRQALQQRKEERQYLLLTIGQHHGGIYLGNELKLSRLVANSPASTNAVSDTSLPQDPESLRKETIRQAVRHIDNALTILRKAYQLPLVVAASAEYLDAFKEISPNAKAAAALIQNSATDSERELKQVLQSFLADWQTMKERDVQQQLEAALQSGKLAVSMTEVWAAANGRRGKLLVAEEDYIFPAYLDKADSVIYADAIPINQNARRIADAVEDAMIKVLNDGGQVALVRKGILTDYLHVALICH